MTRRLVLALALLALAAALVTVTGCGDDQSDKDKFADQYQPVNDRLLKIGRELGTALQSAKGKSNRQLSREFAAFALRLGALNKGVRALETPSDLEDDRDELATQIDTTVDNLKAISGAAANNDPEGAAAATVDLGTSSQALNRAQNKLAKATGAEVGSN